MMKMKVIVAEKPSVAKSIATVVGTNTRRDGYLEGQNYIVTWCVGHLITLCDAEDYDESFKKWSVSTLPIIPERFKTKTYSKTESQYRTVAKLINQADEVICATDAGREGELIFRLVYEKAGCSKPVKRLWISSLETTAIRTGMQNLKNSSEYDNLYQAARCRMLADWLLGINLTRWYTCSYNQLLTCGRVQTPVVNFIVSREEEIKNFKAVPYYVINANLGNFVVSRTEKDLAEARKVLSACQGKDFIVQEVASKKCKEAPKPLYDLTGLQQDANKFFGFSAQETLDMLQDLYENKLVTYPRTDSKYLTSDQRDSTLRLLDLMFERGFYESIASIKDINVDKVINDSKVSDHHAILPTEMLTKDAFNNLPDKSKNILRLIVWRLLLSVSPDRLYESIRITGTINEYEYKADGINTIQTGYKEFESVMLNALNKKRPEEHTVPNVNKGEVFPVKTISIEEKETTPPSRYTEASLLSMMETCGKKITDRNLREAMKDRGLGTPATRAGIIESIIKNGYIERKKKTLVPTEKAFKFISVCNDNIKNPELTASWEQKLAEIQAGKLSSGVFLKEIEMFVKAFCQTEKADNEIKFSKYPTVGKCPRCGKNVIAWPKCYSCESGKDGCGFVVWKNDKRINKTISEANAKKLLETGKYDCLYINEKGEVLIDFKKKR